MATILVKMGLVMQQLSKIPIHQGSNYYVYLPELSFFLNKIDNHQYFSLVRFQLDFWAHIIKPIYNNIISGDSLKVASDKTANKWAKSTRPYKINSFVMQQLYLLTSKNKQDNFYFSVSDLTWWGGKFPYPKPSNDAVKYMQKLIPEIPYQALVWRKWAKDGNIHKLFIKYKDKNIILAAPYYYKNFSEKLSLTKCSYVKVHDSKAFLQVNELVKNIEIEYKKIRYKTNGDIIIIFIAGGAGALAIDHLHGQLKNVFMLELGRSLDVYYYYDKAKGNISPHNMWKWIESNEPVWIKNNYPEIIR